MASPRRIAPDEHFGRRLGRYELLCRLAGGGMSQIYLALRRGAGGFCKHVVIKQILPDLRGDEDFLRMFLREAKITSALNHPNITQVFDLGVDQGELFLVMEFVHGVTLVEVARAMRASGNRIPIGLTAAAIRDTAVALQYVHAFNAPGIGQVVHRDVAEKNVMLTFEGTAKLLDFGIAKSLSSLSRTATGTVKGTPGYISPEQIRGEKVTPRADIFSLGVVLYQCLTDVMLFQGQTPVEQMAATLSTQVQPPSRINLDVPPALDQVVLKALDRDPARRFATAQELADAMEEACRGVAWRPPQISQLLRRYFPDHVEDVQKILALLPDEPEDDATGKAILSQLLLDSSFEQTDKRDDGPWAQVVPPPPQPPPLDLKTDETTRKEGPGPAPVPAPAPVEPKVQVEAQVFSSPPVADGRLTVNLRAEGGTPPPEVAARPEEAVTSVMALEAPPSGAANVEVTASILVQPPGPARPGYGDATVEISDLGRVRERLKGPDALPPNVLARKLKAQKMGVMVGSALVGAAIALVALAVVMKGMKSEPEGVPGPAPLPRQATSAGGSGGGSRGGGGGGGGGGPPPDFKKKGGPKLQRPLDPAFASGTQPVPRWDPASVPTEGTSLQEDQDADKRRPPTRARARR